MDAQYLWNRTFSVLNLEDPAARAAMAANCDIRRVDPNQTLIAQSDDDDQVFFLLEGRARVVLYSAKGQEVWIDSLSPGAVIGEIAALTGHKRTSGIVAETLCVVASFSSQQFKDLLLEFGSIGLALSTSLARRVQTTTQRMFELSAMSAKGRVYGELLRMAEPAEEEGVLMIDPLPNLAALAKRVSTTRETVSRAITELEEKNLLERGENSFLLIDPDQLGRLQR